MAKGLGYWYIEIEKQAFWRGTPHTWVNRYVMSGDDPTAANASSVIGILKGIENQIHPQTAVGLGVGFVEGRAYSKNGGPPIAIVSYNVGLGAGTATGFAGPSYGSASLAWSPTLETCLMVQTPLNGTSSTGKPLYLRKFFRGIKAGAVEDEYIGGISVPDINGVEALVLPWQTGMGVNNWVVIGTSGKQASGPPVCRPYLGNHQIPRGKKKKKSSSSASLTQIIADAAHITTLAGGAGVLLDAVGG